MQKQKKPSLIFSLLFLLVLISVGTIFLLNGGRDFENFNKSFMSDDGEVSKNKVANNKNVSQIIVSILPQVQIVEKIAGDSANVIALIPPGFSAATYEPTTKDIKTVINADIYFRIGHVAFEKINLSKLQEINSQMVVVDTSINNKLRSIEEHDHSEDGDKEDHEAETSDVILNEEIDPHVWLSPKMVKQQSEVIKDSLVEIYPDNKELYEKNYQALILELNDLDQKLATAFAPIQGKTMLTYHPAFGYLADEYGFFQEHIQIEGKEPSIAELQKIIEEAKQQNINVIFVQKQFSKDSAQSIAENIEGAVVQIDPLDPDYLSNIENLASVVSSKIMGQ